MDQLLNDSRLEAPVGPMADTMAFGSDVVAEALRKLAIPFIALNPGSSFRGLHDSLVNFLGNEEPSLLLCLHEEHAVAIAHGYAKVTGRAMAAAVHSNVGLMHASMAVFNAWCDRAPVLLLGATGPVDAAQRRPWIDWIHTSQDQASIVRPYIKWDDQPHSAEAARESILRGYWLANNTPTGPVYINLTVELQETAVSPTMRPISHARYVPDIAAGASSETLTRIVGWLDAAENPLFVFGRVSRSELAWQQRVALAEYFGAKVLTDMRTAAAFPTAHPLLAGCVGVRPTPHLARLAREADIIVGFDCVDLAALLGQSAADDACTATIVHVTGDHALHNGWSKDHQALPPTDLFVSATPDQVIASLCGVLQLNVETSIPAPVWTPPARAWPAAAAQPKIADMAVALRQAIGSRPTALLQTTIAWDEAWWPVAHPLDWVGQAGGGGIGGGPGIVVGAALALKGSGRLPVAVLGDGDFLMGVTALWTAVRYRIPLLIVVGNNSSFYNDELHQERVARFRGRPVENKWIGQKITGPDVDLAGMARSQGAIGIGPVTRFGDLAAAFAEGIVAVDAGEIVVIDVRVLPGYD